MKINYKKRYKNLLKKYKKLNEYVKLRKAVDKFIQDLKDNPRMILGDTRTPKRVLEEQKLLEDLEK